MLAEGVPNHLLFLDPELAHRVRQRRVSRGGRLVGGQGAGSATSPRSWASSASSQRQPYYERALAGETVSYESTGAAGSESGYFRFSYRPSFDESGKVRGIFSMATDISERRKIELELEAKQAELVRSNKDLEQFAYVASHDLKAPLRAIELLVQWITEGLAGYDTNNVQENLGLLAKRTQRLNRLLDDLLAYSRAGRKVGAHRDDR